VVGVGLGEQKGGVFLALLALTLRQSIAGLAHRTCSIHIAPSELAPQLRCGMHDPLVSGVQEGSRSEPPLHAVRMNHCE